MNHKVFFFCICFLLCWTLPLNGLAEKYPVVWSPKSIEQTIGLGGTKDLTVTFASSTSLKNVDLWVVPELQPFVSVEPKHFDTIEKNNPYQVKVRISVPQVTQAGVYNGTIHLRVGSKTYPQTLKMVVNVPIELRDPNGSSSEIGVSVNMGKILTTGIPTAELANTSPDVNVP